ncbi:MAG: hypothetical protein HONBIEJF_02406 [Fimbriimonadaceae bacterium]|nr:hypothetical protein [Fimbriimonadaceae bacterium]
MSRWSQSDDELMWMVAESRDDAAVEDLVARRPELRSEVLKRATMIAGLKGAKPELDDLHRVPEFGRASAPWRNRPKIGRWILVGLPAIALAATSIIVGPTLLNRNPDSPRGYSVANSAELSPDSLKNLPPNPYPETGTTTSGDPNVSATKEDVASIGSAIREPKVTLREERIKLVDAIQRIAQQAGLTIEIAPGLPDFEITASYVDVPAREALGDIGKNFGFTVFDQGDRAILIIPAVDQAAK